MTQMKREKETRRVSREGGNLHLSGTVCYFWVGTFCSPVVFWTTLMDLVHGLLEWTRPTTHGLPLKDLAEICGKHKLLMLEAEQKM